MYTASVLKWQDTTSRCVGLERYTVDMWVKEFYMEFLVLI